MVLTKVFTFVFIFITQVNIICKIRECFKVFFFKFNFISSFLIVVAVVDFSFMIFADRSQPVILNVVSKAVTVVQSLERYRWKKGYKNALPLCSVTYFWTVNHPSDWLYLFQ